MLIFSPIVGTPSSIYPLLVTADDWEGSVKGAYTLTPAGKLQPDGTDSGLRLIDAHNLVGDFTVTATYTTIGTEAGFGVYAASEDATFNSTLSWGNLNSFTASWSWLNGGSVRYGSAEQTTLSYTNGDTLEISRSGSTFVIKKNGSTAHTWSQTSTVDVRLVFGCGNASTPEWNAIQATV